MDQGVIYVGALKLQGVKAKVAAPTCNLQAVK